MTPRRRHRARRRAASTALVVAAISAPLVSTSCSVEQSLPAPYCEGSGTGLIVAQSVPSASQIPCLRPLPNGWAVATVRVNEHHTVVTFDSDRAGEAAAVLRLEERCDATEGVPAPSDLPAATRYDFVERVEPSFRGVRYYVFPGGCVSWTFSFKTGASATESVAIGDALVLISRQDLNDILRETFLDEQI